VNCVSTSEAALRRGDVGRNVIFHLLSPISAFSCLARLLGFDVIIDPSIITLIESFDEALDCILDRIFLSL
jgi:hypothetical protein